MDNSKPVTALGLDYGTKTVGIASGQSLTGSATELVTLRYSETRKSKAQLFINIKKIVEEWKPQILVIGWPLNMDGSESAFCQEVKVFSDKLCEICEKPVAYIDERLTSHEAKSIRAQYENFKKDPVDALAAKILLETWFREQK